MKPGIPSKRSANGTQYTTFARRTTPARIHGAPPPLSMTFVDRSRYAIFLSMDSKVDSNDEVRVKYDAITKRADVFCRDRRVTLAGTYQTIEKARTAAEKYARQYLGKK